MASVMTVGLELFPGLRYYEQCCYEHSHASICVDMFQLSWLYIDEWNPWSYLNSSLIILGNCQLFSIVAAVLFAFLPTVHEVSFSFVICVVFDDRYSNRCEVIPHCGFDLHFLDA